MRERVTVVYGGYNAVFVAPHGYDGDDAFTGAVALAAAKVMGGHAVVNNGWRRSSTVDELDDKANCNNINHCLEPVVKAEFLDPLYAAVHDCLASQDTTNGLPTLVVMVHGVGKRVLVQAGDPNLKVIVGYGAGKEPRITCDENLRNVFANVCAQNNWKTYEGAEGGLYSAHNRSNLTQAVKRKYPGCNVLQIELIDSLRSDEIVAELSGTRLGIYVKYTIENFKLPHTKINAPKI